MRYDPIRTAASLAELDAAMRCALPHARAVDARVRFVTAAAAHHALGRLNSLGDLVPASTLSDRSLDVVLEDPRYSGDVIRALLRLCDIDPKLRQQLADQWGETGLATWRRNHRDLLSAAA